MAARSQGLAARHSFDSLERLVPCRGLLLVSLVAARLDALFWRSFAVTDDVCSHVAHDCVLDSLVLSRVASAIYYGRVCHTTGARVDGHGNDDVRDSR